IVTEKQLIMQFGIIRSRYEIKDIYSVRLFRGSNKLTVYFDDYKTKFMVIVVKDSWYSDFIEALTKRNEKISFDFITPEEERDQKKKK
ncbi:MAG: PH domain-containing protein, partial [Clostridia bacterium]|nr:PH domain-containing protein [Clostridia bacterium]